MSKKKTAFMRSDGKRAMIYVRVSTDEQKKGFGPDAQRKVCRAYCERQGYEMIATVEDLGISGTKHWDARDGLREAVQACRDNAADVIVAYAQDRFARKAGVWEEVRDHAITHGYRLEAAQSGQVLTAEENDITSDAMAFVSSVERKMIVKRLRGGREGRAGIDGRGSSYPPYGYVRDEYGKVIPYDPQAKVVRHILQLHDKQASYRTIAADLNRRGYTAPMGGPWSVSSVYVIVQRRDLYETGRRVWDGIEAAQEWPVIYRKGKAA